MIRLSVAVAAAFLAPVAPAPAQLALRQTIEGQLGYVVAGATLRTESNNGNACAVTAAGTNVTATVAGIPAGATIQAVYLYWGGSGALDNAVTIAGTNVTADATWITSYNNNGTALNYFGGFENLTGDGIVTGNGSYTFRNMTVSAGEPWCSVEGVVGAWALVVVYQQNTLPLRRLQVLDGLRAFRNATETVQLEGTTRLEVSASHGASFTYLIYDGDPTLSGSEAVIYNNNTLSTTNNPLANPFNSVNSSGTTTYGLDLDTWDATAFTTPGAATARLDLQAGTDMVILQTIVTSLDIKGVVVTPDGGTVPKLQNGAYSQVFTVENTSIISGTFDLLVNGTTPVSTIDSIRGSQITSQVRSDSGRVTLSAGIPTNYTVYYKVPAGAVVSGPLSMRGRWTTFPNAIGGQDTGYVDIRRVMPQLTLTKSVNPQNTLAVGTDLTYTMATSNVGEYAARSVAVTDSVPVQVDFKLGSPAQTLPGGVSATVAYAQRASPTVFTYTPVSAGCGAPAGYDRCVGRVRWTLSTDYPSGAAASAASFSFIARIR